MYMLYIAFSLVFCLGGSGFCFWRAMRPRDSLKPDMIPWMFISMGLLAGAFMLLVHIVNLLGFETGRNR